MKLQLLITLVSSFFSLLASSGSESPSQFDWRSPVAGGLAGGIANAFIFPIDTIKTMLQTNPRITTVSGIVTHLKAQGLSKVYSGFLPAVLGSVPSSSLYFGTYETIKATLYQKYNMTNRHCVHILAASSGNLASSFVFVPKEAIKQQLQAYKTGTISSTLVKDKLTSMGIVRSIYQSKGIKGFYPSYRATLARNIPSAAIRFTIFEELKLRVLSRLDDRWHNLGMLFAGGIASGLSSAVTTPFDVIKTRLATGLLPPGSPVMQSMISIGRKEGVHVLYAGMQARIVWSALYGGIGLTTFELTKKLLGLDQSISNKS